MKQRCGFRGIVDPEHLYTIGTYVEMAVEKVKIKDILFLLCFLLAFLLFYHPFSLFSSPSSSSYVPLPPPPSLAVKDINEEYRYTHIDPAICIED